MIALILVAALLVTPVMAAGYDAVDLYDDIPMIVEPELDALDLEDESVVYAARGSYTVYQQASSNGQNYLKAVLANYPATVGYLYARTGQYEYVLWVGGEYEKGSSSIVINGATRYTYTYTSGSSYNSYATVNVSENVNDSLGYGSHSAANVYGSLKGLAALRDGGNNDAISWTLLGVSALSLLLMPMYLYICRPFAQRRR